MGRTWHTAIRRPLLLPPPASLPLPPPSPSSETQAPSLQDAAPPLMQTYRAHGAQPRAALCPPAASPPSPSSASADAGRFTSRSRAAAHADMRDVEAEWGVSRAWRRCMRTLRTCQPRPHHTCARARHRAIDEGEGGGDGDGARECTCTASSRSSLRRVWARAIRCPGTRTRAQGTSRLGYAPHAHKCGCGRLDGAFPSHFSLTRSIRWVFQREIGLPCFCAMYFECPRWVHNT
jgi:hypothetical protein